VGQIQRSPSARESATASLPNALYLEENLNSLHFFENLDTRSYFRSGSVARRCLWPAYQEHATRAQ